MSPRRLSLRGVGVFVLVSGLVLTLSSAAGATGKRIAI
jgi:hypothetical protein